MSSFNVNFDVLQNDIEGLESRRMSEVSQDDLRHTKFWERIGKCCTVSGFLLAAFGSPWLIPIAALLITQGMGCRAFVAHHTGHSAYDSLPGADKYFKRNWGVGWRRVIDCFSWQSVDEDRVRHDIHHEFTNTRKDPNAIKSSLKLSDALKQNPFKRELLFWSVASTWIWQYYTPSLQGVNVRTRPFNVLNFELLETIRYWTYRVIPYVGFHFILLPLMFAPWGTESVLKVLGTRLLADVFMNIYMFAIGVTNHVGEDLYKFKSQPESKGEYYLHQILSTVSFKSSGDFTDYLHCFMNFQIEHHLMPKLPPSKYREAKKHVENICLKHNIPYVEEGIVSRFKKTRRIFLGLGEMKTYVKQKTAI